MPRRVRLLLLLVLIVNSVFSEEIEVSIFFKGSNAARDIFKATDAFVKRIQADNKFLTAEVKQVDCADNETPICQEIGEKIIVKFTEKLKHPFVSAQVTLDPRKENETEGLLFRTFVYFSAGVYESRGKRDNDIDWWAKVPPTLKDKIQKLSLSSEEELKSFGKKDTLGHNFLVFYKPENFHNLAAVHGVVTAAEEAKVSAGLINCETSAILCEDKKDFPVIVDLFLEKENKIYDGVPQTEDLRDWIKTLRLPFITQLNEDIVPLYRSGQIPGFSSPRHTVTMLFSPNKTNEPYRIYEQFARENHGNYHLTALVDKGVERWPHHPALITTKPQERVSQAFVLFDDLTEERIASYIKTSIYPSIHYLSDGSAAVRVYSIDLPVFVFYDPSGKEDATEFAKLAADHPVRWQIASFAAVSGNNMFGLNFAKQLGIESKEALYLLHNKKTGCVHSEPVNKQTKEQLETWLKQQISEDCENKVELASEQFDQVHLWEMKQELLKKLEAPPPVSFHEEL